MNDSVRNASSPENATAQRADAKADSDNQSPGQNSKQSTSASIKGGRKLRGALVIAAVLFVGLAAGVYYFQFVAPYESTDDASIEGDVTAVAPQISGRVVQVLVQDNQEVKEGDALVQIDPRDYSARLSQARANLAAARSQFAQAKAQFAVDEAKAKQQHANLSEAEAKASYAQADAKRYQTTGNLGVSQSQIDLAETQARSAIAQLEVARSAVLAAEAQAELSHASIDTASANIQQNESAVVQGDLNLSYATVRSPVAGHVTRRAIENGVFVQGGQILLAIVPHDVWVVANFKETQLEHIRFGQHVEITVDAYPHHKFAGRVDSIQYGSGARFSLFPPENAAGNYIKILQRVPVKITFDQANLSDSSLVLGPGMSVESNIRVR